METNYSFMQREAQESGGVVSGNWSFKEELKRKEKKKKERC